MEYKYEYICKMKEPVVCELCNKSYAIGRMKEQTKRMGGFINILVMYNNDGGKGGSKGFEFTLGGWCVRYGRIGE